MKPKQVATSILVMLFTLIALLFAKAKGWMPLLLVFLAMGCASQKYSDDPVDKAKQNWNKWQSQGENFQYDYNSETGKWNKR